MLESTHICFWLPFGPCGCIVPKLCHTIAAARNTFCLVAAAHTVLAVCPGVTTVAVGHIAGHTNVVCTAQLATLLASGWPVRRPYLLMVVESHRASGVAAVT